MNNNSSNATVSFGGLGAFLLTGLFVWLKVTGQIDWSWWLVFAPLWIGFALLIAIVVIGALIAFIVVLVQDAIAKKKREKVIKANKAKLAERNLN